LVELRQIARAKPEKTFEIFASEWMDTYAKTNNKASTVRSKYNSLRANLVPYFGKKLISQITDFDVEQFKAAQLKRGLSPKSINNELTVLRRCLKSALEWELIARLPRMRELRVAPQRYEVLTKEEADRLIQSAPEPMWREMIICGLNTGMRLGELCALGWEDINLATKTLTVRHSLVEGVMDSPKNNRIRIIPLTDELYQLLIKRSVKKGLVFAHPDGGHLRKSSWPWKALQRACKAAGLRRIGWHALRHTFASELVRRGAAIRAVQLLMGHATVQMTERYSHLAPSALQETISLLENKDPAPNKIIFGQPVGNVIEKLLAEVL
jgi:integrase